MTLQAWVDLTSHLGLPVAMLVAFAWYHVRVVKDKDAELARINENRVKESRDLSDKLVERDKDFLEMLNEVDKTLTMLADRIK
jgi:hypothetical protein